MGSQITGPALSQDRSLIYDGNTALLHFGQLLRFRPLLLFLLMLV